ncbi:MBL fold metallo-hydrolase [uncultured Maribacter sp.]|uniref:ComEC/Rec2 family competence protein n=1 Tax=uncultured Maribacter sp. TaxID=431308 RepID=UPI0026283F34|nr:MBL fold metallo-hydrolase [uncultured Maribacter sp.]
MRIQVYFISIFLLLFLSCYKEDSLILDIELFPDRTQDFTLWQLDQYKDVSQMGYIIKTDDDKTIVIDGGDSNISDLLYNYILQLGGTVHYWVITHPHKDHAGALNSILSKNEININIESVIYSRLDLELIRVHEELSHSFANEFYTRIDKTDIQQLEPLIGDVLNLGEGVELNILGIKNPKILINHVNNSSLVFQVKSKTKSVLFVGDLGIEGGEIVLNNNELASLQSNYIQMSHHGQDGVSKDFYSAIAANIALWPTPKWLWENNLDAKGYDSGPWKTLIVKNWMDELGVSRNIVAGIEGTIQID